MSSVGTEINTPYQFHSCTQWSHHVVIQTIITNIFHVSITHQINTSWSRLTPSPKRKVARQAMDVLVIEDDLQLRTATATFRAVWLSPLNDFSCQFTYKY